MAVLKFGRGALRSAWDRENVARCVGQRLDLGQRLVVVVGCADGHGGGALTDALRRAGRDAVLRTGSGLGLIAASTGPRARLARTDPVPLRRELLRHEVVVVPGGRAVDTEGRPVRLGEHGSDLTAVAVAAALGTGSCEILSELGGVFTADPRTVPGARLLPEVSWETAALLGRHGARVLDPRAVRMARRHGVGIVFRRASRPLASEGTVVGDGGAPVVAVVCDRTAKGLRYADEARADRAFAAFHAAGFDAVRSSGGPVVALRGADLTAYERLHGAAGGTFAGVPVTVLREARTTQFLMRDGEAALRLVRRLHGASFPAAVDQTATGGR